jgi:hypothetical protein
VHPSQVSELARIRHSELLGTAELRRRRRPVHPELPGRSAKLPTRRSLLMVFHALVQRLAPPRPAAGPKPPPATEILTGEFATVTSYQRLGHRNAFECD